MIEDKSLKRAIKTAVKHGGCCLWINRNTGSVNFWTEDWMAATDALEMKKHLRESMGLLVEMLGYLPERPVKIFKGNGEYMEAGMLPEVAEAEINGFLGGGLEEVARLPLIWRGHALWESEARRIYGVDAGAPHCLSKEHYINGNGCITAIDEDNGEGVFVRCFDKDHRTDEEWEELRHLESYEWHRWERECGMEQMEVEEDE